MESPLRKFTVGRDRKCDVAIADDSVSRLHAEVIVTSDGKLSVTDRGSSNGTYLIRAGKKQRVTEQTLIHSDALVFGTVEIQVKDLLAAIRSKHPDFPANALPVMPGAAAARGSEPKADRLVRCGCGTIKPANER